MTQFQFGKACLGVAAIAALSVLSGAPASALETKIYDLPAGVSASSVAGAPNGKIWFTSARPGALGTLDPATGQVTSLPLGEKSGPSGLTTDKAGNAWIADGGQNAILSVDAKTNAIKTFPMPQDLGRVNLNTIVFDRDGVLWFSGNGANGLYGRLTPATGEIKTWKVPQGRGAQGITVTSDNEIWYVSVASSFIAHVDRATGESQIVPTTEPAIEPHIIAGDSKGNLWVDLWTSGTLNRYSPKTGKWTIWRMPGAAPAHAFATFVDDKDVAWVIQRAANAVYAFDTKTEKFIDVVPGSKPEANVRRISGRPGEIWLPEANTNRIMVVKTGAVKAAAR